MIAGINLLIFSRWVFVDLCNLAQYDLTRVPYTLELEANTIVPITGTCFVPVNVAVVSRSFKTEVHIVNTFRV